MTLNNSIWFLRKIFLFAFALACARPTRATTLCADVFASKAAPPHPSSEFARRAPINENLPMLLASDLLYASESTKADVVVTLVRRIEDVADENSRRILFLAIKVLQVKLNDVELHASSFLDGSSLIYQLLIDLRSPYFNPHQISRTPEASEKLAWDLLAQVDNENPPRPEEINFLFELTENQLAAQASIAKVLSRMRIANLYAAGEIYSPLSRFDSATLRSILEAGVSDTSPLLPEARPFIVTLDDVDKETFLRFCTEHQIEGLLDSSFAYTPDEWIAIYQKMKNEFQDRWVRYYKKLVNNRERDQLQRSRRVSAH